MVALKMCMAGVLVLIITLAGLPGVFSSNLLAANGYSSGWISGHATWYGDPHGEGSSGMRVLPFIPLHRSMYLLYCNSSPGSTYLYSRVICNPEYFLSLCAFLFSVQDKFLQCMVTDVQKIIAIFVSRSEAAHSWVRKLTWCSCETFEKLPENFKLKSCGCAGGACGYTQLTGTPYGNKIAAGSSAIYQNGLGCGQCYDVRDSSCHI